MRHAIDSNRSKYNQARIRAFNRRGVGKSMKYVLTNYVELCTSTYLVTSSSCSRYLLPVGFTGIEHTGTLVPGTRVLLISIIGLNKASACYCCQASRLESCLGISFEFPTSFHTDKQAFILPLCSRLSPQTELHVSNASLLNTEDRQVTIVPVPF